MDALSHLAMLRLKTWRLNHCRRPSWWPWRNSVCIGGVCACCDPSYHIELKVWLLWVSILVALKEEAMCMPWPTLPCWVWKLMAMNVHFDGLQGIVVVRAFTYLATLRLKVWSLRFGRLTHLAMFSLKVNCWECPFWWPSRNRVHACLDPSYHVEVDGLMIVCVHFGGP